MKISKAYVNQTIRTLTQEKTGRTVELFRGTVEELVEVLKNLGNIELID